MTASSIIHRIQSFLLTLGASVPLRRSQLRRDELVFPFWKVKPEPRRSVLAVSWSKPTPGRLKLNTDAAVSTGRAAGGGVLRDHTGKIVFAFYKEFGDIGVLEAEANALLVGLQLCEAKGYRSLGAEVDSQVLCSLARSAGVSGWPLCITLLSIKTLLQRFQTALSHIYREANSVADAIAGLPLTGFHVFESSSFSPTMGLQQFLLPVLKAARADELGLPQIRIFNVRE